MNTKQKWEESTQQQSQQQEDLLNGKDKQNSKFEIHEVPKSPFVIAEGLTEEGESVYIVCLGRTRVSKEFERFEDAVSDAHRIDIERIIEISIIVYEKIEETKKILNHEVK